MRAKRLIGLGLCIQCVFLFFWMLRVPEVSGELKIAVDELQKGDADLPALTIRSADSTESTVTYDPSKSASENLVAREKARLSVADRTYDSIVMVPSLVALFNVVLLTLLLWSIRTKPKALPS